MQLAFVPVFLYLFFAAGSVSALLLGHLEYEFSATPVDQLKEVRTIVVLAGYAEEVLDIPLSSRVNDAAVYRVLEAVHLSHLLPETRILVTGGGVAPRIMAENLVAAGIPLQRIDVDAGASNTYESATRLWPLLGGARFVLVTSAGHMPRAMRVFHRAVMQPLPVPTHYLTNKKIFSMEHLPKPSYLLVSDLAVSEYAALGWYRLRGWI
jgi:uncharacterized SAM-binding protein YcdF (DUF218 family)